MRPGYLKLYASGELQRRIETAWTIMEHCTICPLNCRVNHISEQISPDCHVNIMDQYRPCGTAHFPIDRPLRGKEYQTALEYAKNTGLVQLNELRLADLLRNLGNL